MLMKKLFKIIFLFLSTEQIISLFFILVYLFILFTTLDMNNFLTAYFKCVIQNIKSSFSNLFLVSIVGI